MKKKMRTFSYVFWGILILQSCSPTPRNFPQNPYASWSKNNPGLQKESLPFPISEKWNDRVYPLDEIHKGTLVEINTIDGFNDIPESSSQSEEFQNRLNEIRSSFPEVVNRQFDKYLLGIYFVKNLGTTGLTGIIREKGKPLGGIVFLDTDLLNRKANDWASLKENTVFIPENNRSIQLKIEQEENNTILSGFSFILLHEFGHILAILENHAPDYSLPQRDFRNFPFFKDIWISENESEFDSGFFPERKNIKFYSSKQNIRLEPEGLNIYRKLKNTPFVTLYSATNADDTFSEAYASYVHVILQKKPYEIYLVSQVETKQIFRNGITEENGRKPRKFFDKILGNHQ